MTRCKEDVLGIPARDADALEDDFSEETDAARPFRNVMMRDSTPCRLPAPHYAQSSWRKREPTPQLYGLKLFGISPSATPAPRSSCCRCSVSTLSASQSVRPATAATGVGPFVGICSDRGGHRASKPQVLGQPGACLLLSSQFCSALHRSRCPALLPGACRALDRTRQTTVR